MKTTYNTAQRKVFIALTLQEANTLQELLDEYYANEAEDAHSRFALELAKSLTNLPAVMLYFRDRR